jgi:hypothetical protein
MVAVPLLIGLLAILLLMSNYYLQGSAGGIIEDTAAVAN